MTSPSVSVSYAALTVFLNRRGFDHPVGKRREHWTYKLQEKRR